MHQCQTSQIHRLIAPLLKEILMLFRIPFVEAGGWNNAPPLPDAVSEQRLFQYGFRPRVDNQRSRQLIAPRLKRWLDAAVFFMQNRHNGSRANLALRHAVLPISALNGLDDLRQFCILFC